MLEIFDITLPLDSKTVIWPGLAGIELEAAERMSRGAAVNVTNLHLCAHTGTHVDSVFHHFAVGAGVDRVPMDGLVGPAFVAPLTHVETGITAADLEAALPAAAAKILLLKTQNSTVKRTAERWADDYIYLEPGGAEWLRQRGFLGVGIDSLGIERFGSADGATHKILLGAGIALIEGLDLRSIEPGLYWMACLPLRIPEIDGAPARAILIRDSSGRFIDAWNQGLKP